MYDVPLLYRLLDKYLKRPFLFDVLIAGLVMVAFYICFICDCMQLAKPDALKSVMSDMISVTISLAGFILAALTIIVTFKDSVDSRVKENEQIKSGKDLFFSSDSYFDSVRVFYQGAIFLLLMFLVLSVLKLVNLNIQDIHHSLISLFFISMITLTVFRSLYLLISIIKIQAKRRKPKTPSNS